jgi:glycosyltransferase involved in cell wall biosynthesis
VTPPTLSVVIPVYNARSDIAETIEAAVTAVQRAESLSAEIMLVDDGSTDGSAAAAKEACAGRLPFRVIAQSNQGRFEARRVGVEAASGGWILLLDSRVSVARDALRFVAERAGRGERVWTAHVDVAADRNPYGAFWKLLAELAWDEYFARPRTTSFGVTDFDRFPKGTTCFFAPRRLLFEAIGAFRSRYADLRYANDDTPLIRWIAEREPIHVSPHFAGVYVPRTRFLSFVRHAFHRGTVFLDGHGRAESRFFPVVVGFYPATALLVLAAIRRPLLVPLAAAAVGAAAGAFGVKRRRTAFEVASLALVTPVYAIAHGAGMWRGLGLLIRDRLARDTSR